MQTRARLCRGCQKKGHNRGIFREGDAKKGTTPEDFPVVRIFTKHCDWLWRIFPQMLHKCLLTKVYVIILWLLILWFMFLLVKQQNVCLNPFTTGLPLGYRARWQVEGLAPNIRCTTWSPLNSVYLSAQILQKNLKAALWRAEGHHGEKKILTCSKKNSNMTCRWFCWIQRRYQPAV